MNASRVCEDINHPRRRFIGAAAMTVAAARFGMSGSADAQTGATKPNLPAIKPGTNTTFAPLKQIDAGLLNVGYAEAGPADGPALARPILSPRFGPSAARRWSRSAAI
jgi:hypothetical protein